MSNQILIDGELYDGETGELINKVEEVEVIVEENHLPEIFFKGGTHIQVNLKQLEKALQEELKKFDIEVTDETEKDASKQATKLNKIAKDLNSARLIVSKEIKKPADDLKIAVDNLIGMVQEKRTDILNKVEVFKSARMDNIKDRLEAELGLLYTRLGVTEEFQELDVTHLVKEENFAKETLSKKGKEAIEAMALKQKSIQDNVKIRLLELPISCKELQVPLTREDIEHIIRYDEAEYIVELEKIIVSRLDLEQKIEERRIADEERELLKKEEELKTKQEEIIKVQKETGKKIVKLIATFEVEVDINVDNKKVLHKYQSDLSARYSTLKTVVEN